MGRPNIRLFLYFLLTLIKYSELKLLRGVASFGFYKRWTLRRLIWRRGLLFRPAIHIGIAGLTLLAIAGGAIFGPLPSLAAQNNPTSEIVAPQTTTQTTIPAGRPRAATTEYAVSSGETLGSIAARENVSVDTIKWANNLTSDDINPGQTLLIPPVTGIVHVVAKGETLAGVADQHGVAISDILGYPFNDIPENQTLEQGQIIVVPGGRPYEIVHPAPKPVYVSRPSYTSVTAGLANNYPFGQCTYYVASRRRVPWLDNAGGWYRDAVAAGFQVGRAPRPGAIMVSYEGSPYGHVAYVERVNADGSWFVSEMNYSGVAGGGWGRVSTRTVRPGTAFVVGFIY